jgi:2-polyprenyl-6-methoxyphenol hydroxylase-like FAD-dependent oxidoreductase
MGSVAETLETRCCIVGGGPAGMMLGWLLARAGVDVIVLEKHADFLRDFRGDTIHPSTLELIYELGALERLLAVPFTPQSRLDLNILGESVAGPDLTTLPTHCKYIAMMPQWDFLEFVRREAGKYAEFQLLLETECVDLLRDGGRVIGVVAHTPSRSMSIRADLVVGTDGRASRVRACAELPHRNLGAPIDVLWMRVSRLPSDGEQVLGTITADRFLIMLNRGHYWQCAYLIAKGGFDAIRARGLSAFRDGLHELAPFLGDRVDEITDWDDIKLLTVTVDRLTRWSAPGVLCIGDAAHAMSPIAGVGINLAIQDAVATANQLWRPLRDRMHTRADLDAIQHRREPPTKRMQALQLSIQDHMLAQVIGGDGARRLRALRFVLRHSDGLRRYMARAVGLGFLPEHVLSPEVHVGAGEPFVPPARDAWH